MEGDEKVFAEEEVEFGGVELLGAGEIDRVGDHEEMVVVVLDFWQGTGSDAVFNLERVKLENAFEDGFNFVGRRFVEVDPQHEPLVGAHETERLDFEVAADSFSFTENKGVDHALGSVCA